MGINLHFLKTIHIHVTPIIITPEKNMGHCFFNELPVTCKNQASLSVSKTKQKNVIKFNTSQ